MADLTIKVGELGFSATWEPAAPRTREALRPWLPIRSRLIHCKWSGESTWIPFGEERPDVGYENHTSHPAPGHLLIYTGEISECEILFPYGACSFSSRVGPLAGNHFATLIPDEGWLDRLREVGRQVLWEGAQEIEISEGRELLDLVIRGGTIVTAGRSRTGDVGVRDGRIVAIGPELAADAARVVDASGMQVLPGVIDVHTHLRLPDAEHPDRFRQDTMAAAHGGTTTVLSFNNPGTGISEVGASSPLRGLDEFRARTEGESAIDYGLCAVLSGRQDDPIAELPALIEAGVPTFKAFMVYDFRLADDALLAAMRTAARHGGMLQVHCEEPAIIDPLVADALRDGHTACRYHALTRPARAEGAATRKAIELARRAEAPLYVVHLSCDEALEAVADAKQRGQPVYAETCPHYLTFTDAGYDDADEAEVIKRVISPPLRSRADVDALWAGIRDGLLDVVGSDHVPDRLDTEKRVPAPPFPEISNGGPGIETLLSVVYSEGVAKGRITIERMVEVLATAPAARFGLRSKGAIEMGRDADLVIWDPAARRTLRQAELHHTSDYTPYEGVAVEGAIVDVIVRGHMMGESTGRFMERRLD